MAFAFELNALPVLWDMALDLAAENYPVLAMLREVNGDSLDQAEYVLDLLFNDGYLTASAAKKAASGHYAIIYGVRLTPKALKQLDMWPADNERAIYLIRRIADAAEAVSDSSDTSVPGEEQLDGDERSLTRRAGRETARFLRDFSVEVAAAVATRSL